MSHAIISCRIKRKSTFDLLTRRKQWVRTVSFGHLSWAEDLRYVRLAGTITNQQNLITTCYGLDGPGIESRWGEIFRTCPDRPWGPPSLLYNGYRVVPGGKERPGRDADPSPPLVPWSRKSRAILLLPLWAVRPLQSLSVCTRVHFTFTFKT